MFGYFDGLEANVGRIEGYTHGKLNLRVDDEILLNVVGLVFAQFFESVGDFVDELTRQLFLVRFDGRVEEEYALYLRYGQFGTHVAYALDVGLGLARLQKLTRLNDDVECFDRARFLEFTVAYPLFQVARVVT